MLEFSEGISKPIIQVAQGTLIINATPSIWTKGTAPNPVLIWMGDKASNQKSKKCVRLCLSTSGALQYDIKEHDFLAKHKKISLEIWPSNARVPIILAQACVRYIAV